MKAPNSTICDTVKESSTITKVGNILENGSKTK